MSTVQPTPVAGTPLAAEATDAPRSSRLRPRRSSGVTGSVWWKHVLAIVALVWALFPIVFLVSAALNPAGSLTTSNLLPNSVSLGNFERLFNDPARPYVSWFKNSMLIASIGAFGQVFIGACAAYAFSRMRFMGRRPGLLALLLLQMFPAVLTFVALFLMFSKIGEVIPALGLSTVLGLSLTAATHAPRFHEQVCRLPVRSVHRSSGAHRDSSQMPRCASPQCPYRPPPSVGSVVKPTSTIGYAD